MSARQVINAVGDWALQRTAKQVTISVIIAVVSLIGAKGCAAWRDRTERLIEEGRQEQRDSVAALAVVRLVHARDSVKAVADSAVARMRREGARVDRAAAEWARRARPVIETAQVSGDTVMLPHDSIPHVVDPPVAAWVARASTVLLQQDSLLRSADDFFTNILPRFRQQVDSALSAKDRQIALTDSLATARVEAIASQFRALQNKQAAARPGVVKQATTWVIRAGVLCGAYSLGARKPCWRIVLP